MTAIQLHDMLNRLYTGIGTGNAFLEANVLQQIMDMREEFLYDIFLDIYKSYDTLDRDYFLNILEVYGVGPWALRLLRSYWDGLTMVAQSRGYFRTPFKGYHGVTQGYPLSTTTFNVVVDAVFWNWVTVVEMAEEAVELGAAVTEGFRQDVQ